MLPTPPSTADTRPQQQHNMQNWVQHRSTPLDDGIHRRIPSNDITNPMPTELNVQAQQAERSRAIRRNELRIASTARSPTRRRRPNDENTDPNNPVPPAPSKAALAQQRRRAREREATVLQRRESGDEVCLTLIVWYHTTNLLIFFPEQFSTCTIKRGTCSTKQTCTRT